MKKLSIILPMLTGMILVSCSNGNGDGHTDSGETELYNVIVSVTPDGAGTVSPSTDGSYDAGEIVELEAAANDGYLFEGWTGDVEESENPLSLTVNQDYTLIANFLKKNYELTVNTEGDGTVTERIVPQKAGEYEHGTVVELTAEPADGYTFTEWEGALTSSENPTQLTMDEPKEITAIFERETLTITTDITGEGSVSIIPNQEEYEYGTTVALFAEPDENWEFVEWTGDVSSTENPLEVTMDESKEVTAVFEPKTFTITTHTSGEGTISITPDQEEYEYGTTVEMTAEPDENWGFVEWQGDVSSTENPVEMTVDGPKEVTAVFEQLPFYLAENGVTVKCPEAEVGETGTVGGTTYTKRTADQITPANAATTCTSGITDMNELFDGATGFNEDISHWDVSSVTNMRGMFASTSAFNGDISGWDVSSVTNMSYMFLGTTSFNQDIGSWDVSGVTSMATMFRDASSFNTDLSGWNVDGVTDMSFMFYDASSFNGDIGGWDVGSVTNMSNMFRGAAAFNQDIGGWDVSSVTNMAGMFNYASSFDQDLSGWCVTLIPYEPSVGLGAVYNFSTGAPLTESNKPVWGTCPE